MQGSSGGEDDKAEEKDKEEDVDSDEGLGLEDDNDVGDAVEDMALAEEYGSKSFEEDEIVLSMNNDAAREFPIIQYAAGEFPFTKKICSQPISSTANTCHA
ncbi:hypothetical protein BS17DRAFT_812959 [Gyrodon lividus]|nr:hypothetical protein BS17DRAFT_812959 [Gyrodon lividus]